MATCSIGLDAPELDASPSGIAGTEHRKRLLSHPSLRRDKPQLSCNLCRKRKVRCDRQIPCATCSRRGLARSCSYSTHGHEQILPKLVGTVHERIHQLESLVISLMRQDPRTPACVPSGSTSSSDVPNGPAQNQVTALIDDSEVLVFGSRSPAFPAIRNVTSSQSHASNAYAEANADTSPVPLEGGCMKINSFGTANYVGSFHWAAVLDSIAELKEHFEQEEEMRNMVTDFNPPNSVNSSWPRLLYASQSVTKAEILSSIPPRRAADRLVSRYFTMDIASGVFHTGQFLREYDQFWEDPSAAPIMWIGLLFTIICLGEIHQGNTSGLPILDAEVPLAVNLFRERIVQCLILGKYTKGGPYVLECLIQYYMIEHFLRQDAEFEIWILLGMLIPISLRMGLHRDPKYFPEISAFAGEMRRRMWATIFQIDVGFSALAGLPRTIKPQQCDTEEPRNLLDSDFDENTLELPLSRPESEVTPVLFLLAKNRIISIGGLISDLAHDIRPYPYTELMRFEKLLQDTRKSFPSSLKWQTLSRSIIQGPQVIMQRIYLDMFFHKMQITLYKKYLSASMTQSEYKHAHEVCLHSAMKILEYQHFIDEETQLDGRLSSIRWTYSSITNHDFMLAASVLCSYIKRNNEKDEELMDQETFQKTRSLLEKSLQIWLRSSNGSNEAQKAIQALSIILGMQHFSEDEQITNGFSIGSAHIFAQFNELEAASWPAH